MDSYNLPNGTEPLIFADFKNGVYLINGDAATLGDVIEENLDFGPWNPNLIQPGVGLTDPTTSGSAGPCLVSSLFDSIPAASGCTIVVTFDVSHVNSAFRCYLFDLPEFNNSFTCAVNEDYVAEVDDGNGGTVTDTSVGATKAAFNITITRLAGSIAGRPVFAENATYDASGSPFTNWAASVSSFAILESVGWYPLQAEADLPMLSTP